jgi:RimJ/RimL family protein N-acetyltransferase
LREFAFNGAVSSATATVTAGNIASALLEKSGFRLEANCAKAITFPGWQNDWLFGLLKHEFRLKNTAQQPFGGYFSPVVSSTVMPEETI